MSASERAEVAAEAAGAAGASGADGTQRMIPVPGAVAGEAGAAARRPESWDPACEPRPLLFDTHAHFDDERYDDDRETLLSSLPSRGVALVLNVASDVAGSFAAARLAAAHRHVYAAAGVHPLSAADADPARVSEELFEALSCPKMVAVGEIGLDYHYGEPSAAAQKTLFSLQLELAARARLPVVIHNRDASDDVMAILREHAGAIAGGVFHCFSGPLGLLERVLDMGFYVAYGGACTFRKTQGIADAIARTPLNRLLIETDCPYLAPEPHRGKRNDSSMVGLVAARVAQVLDMPARDLAQAALANGRRLFGITEAQDV